MEKQTKIDRISSLPWDVLDTILAHLPLRDAARTSVLSRKWRYKWTSLSQFVFDDKCFNSPLSDTKGRWGEIMEIIRQVQSGHTGSIEKFKLAALCCPNYSDLDQLIIYLTEKGVKELIIKEFRFFKRYRVPSCLFSSPHLSCLELFGCVFKLPSTFKGFSCLKSLELTHVSIQGDILESLICGCPLLESLTLINIDHVAMLRIHNQNLKYLKIDSRFEDISFGNSTLLMSVDIRMIPLYGATMYRHLSHGKACNLVRVVGSLNNVKKLALSCHFLDFLADENVPPRLPTMLNCLSSLNLSELRFSSLKDIVATFCILRSSPNLKDLNITVAYSMEVSRPVVEFLREQYLYDFDFNNLRHMKIRGISCSRTESEFIKLILLRSPFLETMTIVRFGGERISEALLLQLERASDNVKIISLNI